MKTIVLLTLTSLFAFGDAPAPTAPNSGAATPPPVTEKARALEIRDQLASFSQRGDSSQTSWDVITMKIDNYQKEFGVSTATTNNVVLLRKYELSVAKKFADPARYEALVRQLATDPIPALAEIANRQLAVQKRVDDLKTTPVDLVFTAVDGTAVDLAKLRGKVVLIDFWASWCPECITEAPGIVDVYKRYHDQGFEIVGVSLDEDKAALLAFTQQNGMVWPQYFDGKKWNNDISQRYGISSIPTMWLFDKNGRLATIDARNDFAGQVAKLLQTP